MIDRTRFQHVKELEWLRRFTFYAMVLTFFYFCIGVQSVSPTELNVTFQLGSGNEDIEQLLRVEEMLPGDGSEFKQQLSLLTTIGRIDLSRRDLRGAEIHLQDGDLEGVSFASSNLTDANLSEVHFRECSFRGAKLRRAVLVDTYIHEDCDLEDADIAGCKISITRAQLESTANFKNHDLSSMELKGGFEGCDFSNFDLSNTSVVSHLTDCDLSNANISGCELRSLTREQLMSTKNFKERDLYGVTLYQCDLRGINFSGFDLGHFVDCDLTDAVLENAWFAGTGFNRSRRFYFGFTRCSLTAEQFYSTRNYKSKAFTSRAERIILSGMTLDNWRFDNLDLRGFYFHDCLLTGASFVDARGGSFRACEPTVEQIKSMWNYKNNSLNESGFHISDEVRQKLKSTGLAE